MKITVIIPYRDRPASVALILKQFERACSPVAHSEILIVNLGSKRIPHLPHNCKEIWVDYHGIFSRGWCINIGAKQATHDVIWSVDADAIPHPRIIKFMARQFEENGGDTNFAVNSPVMFLNEKATREIFEAGEYTWDMYQKYRDSDRKQYWVKSKIDGTSQMCLYKQKFMELGGYEEDFFGHGYEDFVVHDFVARDLKGKNGWAPWPKNKEIDWAIENDIILTHLWHGIRNYKSQYMSRYRGNLQLYRKIINSGVQKNNIGKIWGSAVHPPGSTRNL